MIEKHAFIINISTTMLSDVFSFQVKLKAIIDLSIYAMKQVSILAHCCPSGDEPQSATTISREHLSQVASSSVEDEVMVHLFKMMEVMAEMNFDHLRSLLYTLEQMGEWTECSFAMQKTP